MLQPSEALLIGFLGAIVLVAVAALIYILWRVDGRLVDINRSVSNLQAIVTTVPAKMNALDQIRPLTVAVLKGLQAMTETTAAIRGLSGLMVTPGTQQPPEPPMPPLWPRGVPPQPPNPRFDAYAEPDESGTMSQTDEDLAEIERQEMLRQQGIETDPDRIPIPDHSMINLIDAE